MPWIPQDTQTESKEPIDRRYGLYGLPATFLRGTSSVILIG